MLKQLRQKKVAKRILYILAAIIIPAFVIWGSASVLNEDKLPSSAGILFGKKVSFDEFQHALHGWRVQLKLQYGEKAEEIASAFFNPMEAAWDRLTLLAEARRQKIKVSDADVVAALGKMPFLHKDGQFDEQAYDLFLKYALGEQPRTFEEILRENLIMAKVFEQATAGVSVSDEEVRREYEAQNVTTRLKYAAFLSSAAKDKITLSDDDIKTHYEKIKETLRLPPQINAVYVKTELKENASDDEKRSAREAMKRLGVEAKRDGRESGSRFEETAKKGGLEIRETGLFGADDPMPLIGWMPQLASILFGLEIGQISSPLELRDGIYLFKIKEKKESTIPDFNEAKAKTQENLLSQRSKEAARQAAETFLKSLGGRGDAFETEAEKSKIEVKETPFFARDGYIPELGMAETVKETAFKLKPGELAGAVIDLEQGSYIFKCLEVKPLDEEKFKKEKDEFSKQLLGQKQVRAFNEFFQGLKEKARLKSHVAESLLKKIR